MIQENASTKTANAIAFFDFDGTITKHDTLIRFGRFALGRMRLAYSIMASSPWLFLWKIGLISNSTAKQKLFSKMFKGMGKSEFSSLGESFVPLIDSDLRQSTIDLINKHKSSGHTIVIVSASIADWIRPWAEKQGFDAVIATEAETDLQDRLTGRFSTPNCHGKEKVNRIKERFRDLSQIETFAYGDSHGDDEMLAFACHAQKICK